MSNLLGLEDPSKDASGTDAAGDMDIAALESSVNKGGNWFYTIAALSAVNSVLFIAGASVSFVAGLGFTIIADAFIDGAIQEGAPRGLIGVAIVFDLVLLIGFALAGYYAKRRFTSVFVVGLVVYLLDGLIVLALGDYFMAAFHAWALYSIIMGSLACRKLNAIPKPIQSQPFNAPPAPPTFEAPPAL